MFFKKKKEYSIEEGARFLAEADARQAMKNEIAVYMQACDAYFHSPDAKLKITFAERKANYSIHQERLDHAVEDYIEAFRRHYNAGEYDNCETMMFVASNWKGLAHYFGSKYPNDTTDKIIKQCVADVRAYDHTGLYE